MKNLRKARKQSLKSIVQAGRDGGSDSVEINDPSGRQLIYRFGKENNNYKVNYENLTI